MDEEANIKHRFEIESLNINQGLATVSQDVQTRFSVQLTFTKLLSKINENLQYNASTRAVTLLSISAFFVVSVSAKFCRYQMWINAI